MNESFQFACPRNYCIHSSVLGLTMAVLTTSKKKHRFVPWVKADKPCSLMSTWVFRVSFMEEANFDVGFSGQATSLLHFLTSRTLGR